MSSPPIRPPGVDAAAAARKLPLQDRDPLLRDSWRAYADVDDTPCMRRDTNVSEYIADTNTAGVCRTQVLRFMTESGVACAHADMSDEHT